MIAESKIKYAKVISLIDESFDALSKITCGLTLQISANDLFIAVKESSKTKFIAFENYTFQNSPSITDAVETIDSIAKETPLLNHKYKTVDCIIVNDLSTLVPNALYDEDRKKLYLKFNAQLEGDEMVLSDLIKNNDIQNIYALPFSAKAKLDSNYTNIRYHHYSTLLIETLLSQHKNQTEKKLFLHVQSQHLEIIIIENKNLIYYNTFKYLSAEDFIYYVLFVCEQLALNPENIDTLLIGEIERNSSIYAIVFKYIRKVRFGERNDAAAFSYQLQNLAKHSYFSLFNSFTN